MRRRIARVWVTPFLSVFLKLSLLFTPAHAPPALLSCHGTDVTALSLGLPASKTATQSQPISFVNITASSNFYSGRNKLRHMTEAKVLALSQRLTIPEI